MIYVGETSQRLKDRVAQHKYDVSKSKDNTALASHALKEGHIFDFSNVSILGREEKEKKRRILEVINIIKRNDCTVNFKSDVNNVSKVCTSLLFNRLS